MMYDNLLCQKPFESPKLNLSVVIKGPKNVFSKSMELALVACKQLG